MKSRSYTPGFHGAVPAFVASNVRLPKEAPSFIIAPVGGAERSPVASRGLARLCYRGSREVGVLPDAGQPGSSAQSEAHYDASAYALASPW
jgi:hypothetical protein